jgi:hypothetical protein
MTVQKGVTDISIDVETHFSEIFIKCVYCSQTVDESSDITQTAQKCIFARGVISHYKVFEELIYLN